MRYIRKDDSGEMVIGSGNLPGLKKPCLYVGNEYCIEKVASFNSEDARKLFEAYFEKFLGVNHAE